MTHKVYEYEGKHYCEEDISLTDPKYAGDIWDLYWVLHRGEPHLLSPGIPGCWNL